MGRHFPVREKSGNFEQTGKVRENHTKYWKTDINWDKYYLIFLVIFKWTVYYLLKWIKFSVKKQNIKKVLEKWQKILEKSGNFVSLEKWEPWGCVPPTAVAVPGRSPPGTPPPRSRAPPQSRHPPGADFPPEQVPRTRHTHPPDQAPPCGQTHVCKHITLPQTSFAGGKYWRIWVERVARWLPTSNSFPMIATK